MKKMVAAAVVTLLLLVLPTAVFAESGARYTVTASNTNIYESASVESTSLAVTKEGFQFTAIGTTKSFLQLEFKKANDETVYTGYILKADTDFSTAAAPTPTKENSSSQPGSASSSEGTFSSTSYQFRRNQNATITYTGAPNTQYSITVYYSSGVSKAAGLDTKTADASGTVSWTWKIGGRTNPGTYRAVIQGNGEAKTIYFDVISS